MSVRSNWCEFDKETRKYIKKRDKERCVVCGKRGGTQAMHIFLSRSHGGKGSKENGCLGCVKCHKIIDSPIGKEENKLSAIYLEKCKKYLIEKENIKDIKKLIESLKFNKQEYIRNLNTKTKEKEIIKNNIDRCKNCLMLVKTKTSNSTIPSYYCKYKKLRLNKTTKACSKFRRK